MQLNIQEFDSAETFPIIRPLRYKLLERLRRFMLSGQMLFMEFHDLTALGVGAVNQAIRSIIDVNKRYTIIGELELTQDKLMIDYWDAKGFEFSYNEIGRIDIYFYRGLGHDLTDNNIFQQNLTMRMRLIVQGEEVNIYVQNNNVGRKNTGRLYRVLEKLRKQDLGLYRKIQFWEKF